MHAEKAIRLIGRFVEGRHVAGHKMTCDEAERLAERERLWSAYRAGTIEPETKAEWNEFWTGQNGVRGLFLMRDIVSLPEPIEFREYSRVLDWGYPTGVAYRYLGRGQAYALLRAARLPEAVAAAYLGPMVGAE